MIVSFIITKIIFMKNILLIVLLVLGLSELGRAEETNAELPPLFTYRINVDLDRNPLPMSLYWILN